MADKRVTDMGAPTGGPASGDKINLVDVSDTSENAAGSSRVDTIANIVTKAHGLSDGLVEVASGTMGTATAGTDYYAPGSTDVAVADGGTGASTASGARTNLGVAIGTDVQAYDAHLDDLAAISPAQGDIIYFDGTDWVSLAAGTSGHFLKTNGAAANPAWAASSGQTTFDAIVASSGGTHTTLGAAIAAASAGWRILVLDNTTESGAVTLSLANIYITGVSRTSTKIDMGANVFTANSLATGLTIENLGFNVSNGASAIRLSGVNTHLNRVFIDCGSGVPNGASAADKLDVSGSYSLIQGCDFITTSTSQGSASYLLAQGVGTRVISNHFKVSMNTNVNTASIRLPSAKQLFQNNYVEFTAAFSGAYGLYSAGAEQLIDGNVFNFSTTTAYTSVRLGGARTVFSNNHITCSNLGIQSTSDGAVISDNTIRLAETASAIAINQLTSGGTIISGNAITTSDATLAGDGIYINNVDDCIVNGNRIKGFADGIEVVAGSDRTVVTGNALNGNTAGLTDGGTGTVSASNS